VTIPRLTKQTLHN